ncbi:MAG TPA: TAT-variant-translocated molybdopterin oxidoreductase [Myxococcaceae bacterium]
MNPKNGAPSQATPSSFALPVVSNAPAAQEHEHDHDHPHAHDEVGAALDHAASAGVATEGGYGRTYWRSLEERLGKPEYLESVKPEFPEGADLPPTGVARREFMQLIGASLALAGATACTTRPSDERLVPFTKTPPELVPGNALHYASGMTFGGHTSGLLITAREGRPIKIEGNPEHPINRGAAGPFEQAFLISLYEPNRARVLRQGKAPRSLRSLAEDVSALVNKAAPADGGARVRFLTEPLNSPMMGQLRSRILQKLPNARFYSYAPVTQDAAGEGARALFGAPHTALYDFSQADIILSLDADFLESRPVNLAYARQFASRRDNPDTLNRLYVAETRFSITGGMADHRLRLKSSEILGLAAAVAQGLGGAVAGLAGAAAAKSAAPANAQKWIDAVVSDLRGAAGRCVVVAGERQPAAVHALAHAINVALGNVGKTVRFVASAAEASNLAGVRELVADIKAGRVDTLVITAFNPVYSLPADVGLAEVLDPKSNPEQRGKLSVLYTSLFEDETAALCDWFVPAAHQLETWSDGRSVDGTVSIAQPLIQPLFNGVPESELLALFLDEPYAPAYQMLRDFWRGQPATQGADFESSWEKMVATGIVPGTTAAPVEAAANTEGAAAAIAAYTPPQPVAGGQLEINFVADYKVFDGRFANNAWLQELPDPITKLVWDNPALISPKTAEDLKLETGDVAELSYRNRKLEVPVWVMPGHADGAVTLPLGYGRTFLHETAANGTGYNANVLRSADAPWFDSGATLTKARKTHQLVSTQKHWSMAGRPVALDFTVGEWRDKNNHNVQGAMHRTTGNLDSPTTADGRPNRLNNLPPFEYGKEEYKWGMAIDLSRCTGCSACVVACQSENNIPVVGKDQVSRSREMHWLRIDRYFTGPGINPKGHEGYVNYATADAEPGMVMQPVMCVHCEKAPCEYVCPVNATVHSDEGLNDMVYNRCVGTRYCSNNCPYKVRRFNYLHYSKGKTPTEKMQMNPDVTVRNRGVMEKCTYCVQRIERVRITSRVEKRAIAPNELQTACQQTCPTEAITFGSLNDEKARVTQLHADPRHYKLLYELGTQPRTAHLVRLRNPHPSLAPAPEKHEGGH